MVYKNKTLSTRINHLQFNSTYLLKIVPRLIDVSMVHLNISIETFLIEITTYYIFYHAASLLLKVVGLNILYFMLSFANGHITLNIPVLVRSLKSSNVEPG